MVEPCLPLVKRHLTANNGGNLLRSYLCNRHFGGRQSPRSTLASRQGLTVEPRGRAHTTLGHKLMVVSVHTVCVD